MNDNQDKLIREEQKILDHLIDELDDIMLEMDRRLTRNALQAKKAKEKSLPDTYGILISTEHDRKYVKEELKNIRRVRNQLYEDRLVLECTDQYGTEEEELKVGLHSFVVKNRVYVTSWLRPVCRHYIMNNSEDDFDGVVEDEV